MGKIAEVPVALLDDTVAAEALAYRVRADQRLGDIHAEIVAAAEPKWHILTTEPMHESIAAAHLIARRFGVYLPMIPIVRNGRDGRTRVAGLAPMFPGYLFVFVWDIARHWGRMRAMPGVRDLMLQGDGAPAVVSDDLINAVQMTEFVESERVNKPKRRRGSSFRGDSGGDKITIRPKSYWRDHLKGLAPGERISLLARALEIGS